MLLQNNILFGNKKAKKKFIKKKLFILLGITLALFIADFFLSGYLREIQISKNLYTSLNTLFHNLFSLLRLEVCLIFFILIFINYDFIISFKLITIYFSGNYICNMLKMIYKDPRPYWDKDNYENFIIPNNVCINGTLGKPSTTSFMITALGLSIWKVFKENNKYNCAFAYKISDILSLISVLILIMVFLFGKLLLLENYLDQLLLGAFLGLIVFNLNFFIFPVNNAVNIEAFFKHFRSNKKKRKAIYFFSLLMISALAMHFISKLNPNQEVRCLKADKEINCQYIDSRSNTIFFDICNKADEVYLKDYEYLYECFKIFGLLGAYVGLIFITKHINLNYSNNIEEGCEWNKTGFRNKILIFFMTILGSFPIIMYKIVPIDDMNIVFIIIFKVCVPFFFLGFSWFGLIIWLAIEKKLGNKHLYNNGSRVNTDMSRSESNTYIEI